MPKNFGRRDGEELVGPITYRTPFTFPEDVSRNGVNKIIDTYDDAMLIPHEEITANIVSQLQMAAANLVRMSVEERDSRAGLYDNLGGYDASAQPSQSRVIGGMRGPQVARRSDNA